MAINNDDLDLIISDRDIAKGKQKRKIKSPACVNRAKDSNNEISKLLRSYNAETQKSDLQRTQDQADRIEKIRKERTSFVEENTDLCESVLTLETVEKRISRLLHIAINDWAINDLENTHFEAIRNILHDRCWDYFFTDKFNDKKFVEDLEITLSKQLARVLNEKNFLYSVGSFFVNIFTSKHAFLSPVLEEAYKNPQNRIKIEKCTMETFDEVFKKCKLEKPEAVLPKPSKPENVASSASEVTETLRKKESGKGESMHETSEEGVQEEKKRKKAIKSSVDRKSSKQSSSKASKESDTEDSEEKITSKIFT